jgi:hypothetical protein
MFEGLSPKVEELLNAAKSDLPAAHADAGLIESMTLALSVDASAPVATPRNGSLLGKAFTAKTAAMASVLLLSCGVASAATGILPAAAQDAASNAAEHVGLHIPKSDDNESEDANDDKGDDTSSTVEHPDNHGNDVSTVAHDDSTEGADHGTAVCTVASDGKCQPNADNSGQGNSGDHRQDGDHPTTSTTVNDDNGGSDNSGNSGNSGSDHPTKDSHPGDSHSGSDD